MDYEAIRNKTEYAMRARAKWLDDVLAGQIAKGTRFTEIEIEEHPGPRTVVKAAGKEIASWRLTWLADNHRAGG